MIINNILITKWLVISKVKNEKRDKIDFEREK